MSWFYRELVRPLLFRFESEAVHNATLEGLRLIAQSQFLLKGMRAIYGAAPLPVKLWDLTFPNPVGLAAGMDKQAAAIPVWEAMGFGFCELGGVTWHAQPGNPAPRMFRALRSESLVNRMGFNNPGAEFFAANLAKWRCSGLWPKHPVGVNLGKSKITPLEKAAEDYAQSLQAVWRHADFFVINVSSPNTPNLRQLQDRAALDEILAAAQSVNRQQALLAGRTPKPLLVKVAPDLSFDALDEILELVGPRELSGIVATNTTIERPPTTDAATRSIYNQQGGLSGRPLRHRSTEVIRHLHRQSKGKVPLIGVGGIFSASDALEKFEAGATLVQVYSGLVYEGPGLVRSLVKGLIASTEKP